MRNIREILRLRLSAGLSIRAIHRSTKVSVGAVQKLLARAAELELSWPLPDDLDDAALAERFYPGADTRVSKRFTQPDWAQIHQELNCKGMTKQLLWEEYTQQHPNRCYSYSQFCDRYRQVPSSTRRYRRDPFGPGVRGRAGRFQLHLRRSDLGQVWFALNPVHWFAGWMGATFVMNLAEAALFPTMSVQIDRLAPDHLRGSYFGASSFYSLGWSAAPVVGGIIIEWWSGPALYWLMFGLCGLVFLLYRLTERLSRPRWHDVEDQAEIGEGVAQPQ